MALKIPFNVQLYVQRRHLLLQRLQGQSGARRATVLLMADLENSSHRFEQEASFFYLTGIHEPGVVLALDLEVGTSELFVPNFGAEREKWVAGVIQQDDDAQQLGFSCLSHLGAPLRGYQLYPYATLDAYQNIVQVIENKIGAGHEILSLIPTTPDGYVQQRFLLGRLIQWIPQLAEKLIDISGIVAAMRRTKSDHEIALLDQAIEITAQAQFNVARLIKAGLVEYELQAKIESTFIERGAEVAFPSIVATGQNGTVLHYMENSSSLAEGDLVVIDIGARYGGYCADITRTYPVSRSFTSRQREIYQLVLEAQTMIANLAKPGLWLSNADYPDYSLNHLARKFFQERGYGEFFIHGIGHFLGLDVHDVGDYGHPLEPGDVITIEPGLYLRHEGFGVRIEDNYLITVDGVRCLSQQIPKHPDELIDWMLSKN